MTTNTDLEGIAVECDVVKELNKAYEKGSSLIIKHYEIKDAIKSIKALQSIHSNDKLVEEIKRMREEAFLQYNNAYEKRDALVTQFAFGKLEVLKELLQFQEGMK